MYTKEHPQYFIFNADKVGIGRGPRATACAFWNDFLPRLRDNTGKSLIQQLIKNSIIYDRDKTKRTGNVNFT